ncbi:efflux RND transporter periplasmic adaptor subunit [Roseovarius sp. SYSU LYC5161]|uniref:efflux RND transporter periplasmic adaptor subunit n=1 Tax=Roseovarius halophilus (ex Wu et al. 2025) TaxID=3376060 RepID=UPI003999675E
MRFLRHSLIGLLLLAVTLGMLAYGGTILFEAVQERMTRQPPTPERRERVFAVNVVRANEATITPVLRTFGEVQSRRTLEIRAKTGGTIVDLAANFEEGGEVRAGQRLARIDPADAQAALDRAETDLMDARAEQREADRALILARDELAASREQAALRERAFQRQRDLEDRGVGTAATVETAELAAAQARQAVLASRQALARAEARVDQAATRLARAEIARDEAQRRLDDTEIRAGFSGILSDVSVVEGGVVSQNEQMAHLVDGTALEVAFRVSTAQYARLLDGDGRLREAPVTATLDVFGLDLAAEGRVSRDSAAVGDGQTGRRVFARLDTAAGFKPGDFVTVRIEEPPLDNVIRLPAQALGADDAVLVLDDDNRLVAQAVTLLRRQGDHILVRAAALDGRDVVAQRTPLLGEGIKVRPLERRDNGSAESGADPNDMIELSASRRARLIGLVQADPDLTEAAKLRLVAQLEKSRVPARTVRRLEGRMDG